MTRKRDRWLFKVEDKAGRVRGVWGRKIYAKQYRDTAHFRVRDVLVIRRGPEHVRGETGISRHVSRPQGGWDLVARDAGGG